MRSIVLRGILVLFIYLFIYSLAKIKDFFQTANKERDVHRAEFKINISAFRSLNFFSPFPVNFEEQGPAETFFSLFFATGKHYLLYPNSNRMNQTSMNQSDIATL